MKSIKYYISLGLVGCRIEDVIEVEDDATDEEIEETIRDIMFEHVEYGRKRSSTRS